MVGGNYEDSQIWTVVGCGETAKDWQQVGHSIGVNDAWKWGKPTDSLLICNRPDQFFSNKHRFDTIVNSKPKYFYSNTWAWEQHFKYPAQKSTRKRIYSNNPANPVIKFMQWSGTLYPDYVFYSDTSPFIAISLAYYLGAKDIILWGCDFKTHHIYHERSEATKREVKTYTELISALKEKGVNVWLGKDGTAFDGFVPVFDFRQHRINTISSFLQDAIDAEQKSRENERALFDKIEVGYKKWYDDNVEKKADSI